MIHLLNIVLIIIAIFSVVILKKNYFKIILQIILALFIEMTKHILILFLIFALKINFIKCQSGLLTGRQDSVVKNITYHEIQRNYRNFY